MILPTKHIKFSESLLGFGAYILEKINYGKTVDFLWNEYQKDLAQDKYFIKHSFDTFLITLVFLNLIGAIKEMDGGIVKCIS